ncbi:hypothetical protein UFOVP130_36 [uncultured Caudovirales phage]|uniref:Uncharacterized protein n=1 Tax=uncultured Caudovirales phage TaxID=2100421 RepID=A0A6J5LBT8_9CAUD|nr:hypothetical protein UFOVP130_36 [uncultured Caudovirales phage]
MYNGQNIKAFWAAVRHEAEALTDEFYYLMSLTDPTRGLVGGVVVQASKATAAQALVQKTHRLATSEEIAAWDAAETEKRKGYEAQEAKRMSLINPLWLQQQQGNTQPPAKPAKEK